MRRNEDGKIPRNFESPVLKVNGAGSREIARKILVLPYYIYIVCIYIRKAAKKKS